MAHDTGNPAVGDPSFTVANEFAAVEVTVHDSGNGTRLVVHDLRSGRTQTLDALALETLAWLPDHLLEALSAPAVTRWDAVETIERIVEAGAPGPASDAPE